MSLTFGGATSDRVDCGSGSSLDDLTTAGFTVWAWVYRTGTGANQEMVTKDGSFPSGWDFAVTNDTAEGELQLFVGYNATQASYVTNSSNVIAANTWTFVAGTFDPAANPQIRLYLGTLSSLAAESSGYSTATNGVGTIGSDASANLYIGNLQRATTLAFKGRMGPVGVVNRALSAGELQSLQYNPRMLAGTVGLWMLGDNGTGTQPDYSGNGNSGTVTGATQSDNPPLRRWGGRLSVFSPYTTVVAVGGRSYYFRRRLYGEAA